jgi:hypothetical protein
MKFEHLRSESSHDHLDLSTAIRLRRSSSTRDGEWMTSKRLP